MMKSTKGPWIAVVAVIAVAAAVVALAMRAQAPPTGVRPVAWDKQTCAECAMAVSDRRFAAQLHTRDGQVLNFDDPGCLFDYHAMHAAETHAIYFHRADGPDEWLTSEQVGFAATKDSPMGYGLAAVPRDTPDAISFEQAREKMRQASQGGPL